MAFTFQQIADRARLPLNDAAKTRWPDAELLGYGVDAYLLLRLKRPDIFVTGFASLPDYSALTLGSSFPSADDSYLPAIADYVSARAQLKDDEAAMAERATTFYGLFRTGVSGG